METCCCSKAHRRYHQRSGRCPHRACGILVNANNRDIASVTQASRLAWSEPKKLRIYDNVRMELTVIKCACDAEIVRVVSRKMMTARSTYRLPL